MYFYVSFLVVEKKECNKIQNATSLNKIVRLHLVMYLNNISNLICTCNVFLETFLLEIPHRLEIMIFHCI